MTPEREAERLTPEVEERCRGQGGDVHELLSEIDRLREKYARLKELAKPFFLTAPAKLSTQSTDGRTYILLEVSLDDIFNLRDAVRGT
jgi:hypothetical protein